MKIEIFIIFFNWLFSSTRGDFSLKKAESDKDSAYVDNYLENLSKYYIDFSNDKWIIEQKISKKFFNHLKNQYNIWKDFPNDY